MNFQKIPDKLKQIPHWVVWRLEYKEGRAKPTKPPYSARNGDPAKVNDPSTWSTFEEAVQAYQGGGYNGIGFVFTGTPYVGIDIDDCHDPETGEVTPEAQDILAKGQTYTELSQSGRGFHLILEGKMPGTKRRTGDFEMYDCTSARYFAITGNACFDFGIQANQGAIDFVYHKYIDPPKSEPPKPAEERVTSVSYLTDQEVLEAATKAQNGQRFSSLWDGDTKDYPSSSEADLALANHLAFWCRCDINQMDQLFRQSGLMRPKWDSPREGHGSTYGIWTLQKAVDGCLEMYDPKTYSTQRDSVEVTTEPVKGEFFTAAELQKMELGVTTFVVEEFLHEGLSMLAAPPKSGKSFFALDACISVALGQKFMGFETVKSAVAYLALEDSKRRLKDRINMKLGGCPWPGNFYLSIVAPTLDTGLADYVGGFIKGHPDIKLLVIDILQRVRSRARNKGQNAYEFDSDDIGKLKAIADEHGICILAIHHLKKGKEDDAFARLSGSMGILGAADQCFIIENDSRSQNAILKMVSREIQDQDWKIRKQPNSPWWEMVGTTELVELEVEYRVYQEDPVVITIKALLEEFPEGISLTASEFMDHMVEYSGEMLSELQIGHALRRLKADLWNYDKILHSKKGTNPRKHLFTKDGSLEWDSYITQH